MKKVIIILVTLFMMVPSYSQALSKKEQRKMEKEIKRELQEEEDALKAELVNQMVHHHRFVLEADMLRDMRGNSANVSSMINFIVADSTEGVIQVGSNTYVGMNGVGGITVEGPLTKYEYSLNKKNGVYHVAYNLHTTSGYYDVMIMISPDGRADATISSNWPGKLVYSGYIIPPALSRVYKGTSY